jgi:hypothetical protein
MKVARKAETLRPEELRAFAESARSLRALSEALEARRAALVAEHPGKWIAFGPDGVEATAASQEALLDQVDVTRVREASLIIEYLAVNPPRLLL